MNAPRARTLIPTLCTLATVACGGDDTAGSGSLAVLAEAEETITEGLAPGTGAGDIRDGWTVEFDKYIVALGDIDMHLATDENVEAEAHEVFVVDLTEVPSSGLELWELEDLRAGRWEFHFTTTGAAHDAERHETVSEADFDDMESNDLTYLIDGTLSKDDGRSCPPESLADPPSEAMAEGINSGDDPCYENTQIRFTFGVSAETVFGPCERDGVQGVAITDGGRSTAAITIHGDHIFFNGFPEGSEGGVQRLAQWLADSDLDVDGTVTREELESIAPADLPEIDDRYQLGGHPLRDDEEVEDMWDYLAAQLKTQGHFQGEGECPIDGVAHEHEREE